MFRKHLLAISLGVSLIAASGVARADHYDQYRSDDTQVKKTCTYRGGPKSGVWECRYVPRTALTRDATG